MQDTVEVRRIAAYGSPYIRHAYTPGEEEYNWSPRKKFLFIVGSAALAWAGVFALIGFVAGLTMFVLRVVVG
jgi:hypothetical protein